MVLMRHMRNRYATYLPCSVPMSCCKNELLRDLWNATHVLSTSGGVSSFGCNEKKEWLWDMIQVSK